MTDNKEILTDENKQTHDQNAHKAAADTKAEDLRDAKVDSKNSQKTKFAFIHQDLKSALNVWEELSHQAPALAADEKQLHEVKEILRQLQDKMAELDL